MQSYTIAELQRFRDLYGQAVTITHPTTGITDEDWALFCETVDQTTDRILVSDCINPTLSVRRLSITPDCPDCPGPPQNSNDPRDKWIYNECMKGTAYGTVILQLSAKPEEWERIESPNGVRGAAKRYAERHGLPLPPPRQAGRPPS